MGGGGGGELHRSTVISTFLYGSTKTKKNVISVQSFTKYSIFIVDVKKAGDLCTKAGEREMRQKSVSLPIKAGELASLVYGLVSPPPLGNR